MSKEFKPIDWTTKSKEDNKRHDYYLSLGYDEIVASVLALTVYGRNGRRAHFSFEKEYEALVNPLAAVANEIEEMPNALHGSVVSKSASFMNNLKGAFSSSVKMEKSASRKGFGAACLCAAGGGLSRSAVYEDGMTSLDNVQYACDVECEPMGVMETDEYEHIEEKGFRNVLNNLTSTFRMTTNTASAGIVFHQLRNSRRIDRSMVRIEEMLNYFRYLSKKPKTEMFEISHEIMNLQNGNKLLYVNVQGKEDVKAKQNIIVLLDVSGSMFSNASVTQAAIATIISKLKKGDVFTLVTYSSRDEVVVNGYTVRNPEVDKKMLLSSLMSLDIDGCTYGSAGIEKAYEIGADNYIESGNNQVILITDGDLNFGVTDRGGLEELITKEKQKNLFLSVLGTGLYNYKDEKLETLCKYGNGVYRVINNLNDVIKNIHDEYSSLVNIIAKDVKAQVEFNPAVVKSFRLLGFENREISHEDFVNDKVVSEPFGSGGYGIALYELELASGSDLPKSEYKYASVTASGSSELATVKVRYKDPLSDTSKELEHVIENADETFTDNLRLAEIVYVCAEKLRNSDKITEEDEKFAKGLYDQLGDSIRQLNESELPKLAELLEESKKQLKAGLENQESFEW